MHLLRPNKFVTNKVRYMLKEELYNYMFSVKLFQIGIIHFQFQIWYQFQFYYFILIVWNDVF